MTDEELVDAIFRKLEEAGIDEEGQAAVLASILEEDTPAAHALRRVMVDKWARLLRAPATTEVAAEAQLLARMVGMPVRPDSLS